MERRLKLPPAKLQPVPSGAAGPAADRGAELPFDAVITFDARGILREFNPGAEQLFGWSRDDAIGRALGERLFPGELQRRFLEDLVRQFDCADPAPDGRRVELVASRPDGRRVPVELAVACLGDDAARTFVAFVRDMAGRKRLVEELRGQADRLAAIAKVQQELAASEASLDELTARVAEIAQRALNADGAAFEFLKTDRLVYRAVSGSLAGQEGRELPLEGSLSGLALREDRPLWSEDCESDPRADRAACRAVGARSMAVAVLHAAGRPIGVIKVVCREAQRLGPGDAQALALLATSIEAVLQRKRDLARLTRSEEQYRMLFHDNPHPMWVFDPASLRFLAVNAAAVAQYGYTRDEFLGMTVRELHDPGDKAQVERAVAQAPTHRREPAHWRHVRRDGTPIDVEIKADAIEFEGRPARLVLAHDVTARLRAEAGQASANRALRMLGACNDAMVRIDDEKKLLDEICRIVVEIGGYKLAGVGYAQHDAERSLLPMAAFGDHPEVVTAMRLSWGADSPYGQGPAGRCIRSGKPIVYPDLEDDAQGFPWRDQALAMGYRSAITLPLRNLAGSFGFLGMYSGAAHDVQGDELRLLQEMVDNVAFGIEGVRARLDRRRIQAELEYSATHDAVTGLPRYAVLEPRLARMADDPAAPTAVLLVDLDRFNGVNEAVGHAHADDVLRTVAGRLLGASGDHAWVAHLAGDEFVVVARVAGEAEAIALAERIRTSVCRPIEGDGYRLVLTATVGVSVAPEHGREPIDLLRRAQAAMERGKGMGRDCVSPFLTGQVREIEDRMTLGGALRGAARAGELQLHYQPQYAAQPHRLTGFEALLRWTNPTLGAVSPGRFIPIAEALGLMPEIGAWVLREACRQARAWLDAGHADFNIAVNVSAQQLQRPGLVQAIADAIAEHGIPPSVLDIELTESSLMENVARVQGTLAELKALGVMLSLDDFGTGYSSLAYLKHFSLDKLKIDQSFVRGLPGNVDDAAIARTIVSIGHQLRMIVAAEGVETQEQAEFLRGIGCDELQGYFLGRPSPPCAAEALFGG
jgi:diguanylate cyclase (GGDEF)-like protein/PAS domain S-box-containing protein